MTSLNQLYRNVFLAFASTCFLKLNPSAEFNPPWYVEAMCHELEKVLAGDNRRLMLNLPPRCLKTTVGTIAFACFYLGKNPDKDIILATYGDALSEPIMRNIREILNSDFYRHVFPEVVLNRQTTNEITTTRKGSIFATSVGGSMTGKGADLIIIDDPAKAQDSQSEARRENDVEWMQTTPFSRFNDPRTGSVVIVAQRTHEADIVGSLTAETNHPWTVLAIPAQETETTAYDVGTYPEQRQIVRQPGDIIDPERYSEEYLEQLRNQIGSSNFEAQYQQYPLPMAGNIVKRDWIQTYTTDEYLEREIHLKVCSWDTALSVNEGASYSVCTVWAISGKIYMLKKVIRVRMETPKLIDLIDSTALEERAHVVLIENNLHGRGCAQELMDRKGNNYFIYLETPACDKATRLAVQTPAIEQGRLQLPEQAPWLDTYENELFGFPNTRYTDQIDSTSQFLNCARNGRCRNTKGRHTETGVRLNIIQRPQTVRR